MRASRGDIESGTTMSTVSDTAHAIAFIRAHEADLPPAERLFEDPYAPLFVAAAAPEAREGTARFLSLPFFRDGVRLRTRHIDDLTRESLSLGARQLVLLGAGFDTRALRLPEVSRHRVSTFEIDLPALLATKRSLLAAAAVPLPPSLHSIPCDFATDFESPLTAALAAHDFDRTRPTLFLWAGVIAYLTEAAISRTLAFIASLSPPGSRLIFDFSDYVHGPDWAPSLTRAAGFPLFESISFDTLWRRHLPGAPHPSSSIVKLAIASR